MFYKLFETVKLITAPNIRYKTNYRDKCIPIIHVEPRCAPINLKKCQEERKAKRNAKKVFPFKHLLPYCCDHPCPWMGARFDDLYYKVSDKDKKQYTQTWKSCDSPLYKKKMICCYDNLPPIPYKKRKFLLKSLAGSCDPKPRGGLMACKKVPKGRCPKIVLPCCKPVRNPPTCKIGRKLIDCMKICTPYPSFSECAKDKIPPKRKRECECLARVSLCYIYQLLAKGLIQPIKKFPIK